MSAITSELEKGFGILRECCPIPGVLDYFFSLTEKYFDPEPRRHEREVMILGPSFLEELLMAYHIYPHWVPGGGLAVGDSVDSMVPRDADATSRSIFGYLNAYQEKTGKKLPVIVPITGDNLRKLCYLLEEDGWEVYPLDIMPYASSGSLYFSIATQLDDIMDSLTLRWQIPGTAKGLRRAAQKTTQAKTALYRLFHDPDIHLNGIIRHYLATTYFYADDLTEWTKELECLGSTLRTTSHSTVSNRPGVLIIGSPVLFPNYKVPLLLEECGLEIVDFCSWITGKTQFVENMPPLPAFNRQKALRQLVAGSYSQESSGAFVQNQGLYAQAVRRLERTDLHGVILHILKGQIEYDFEANRLESLFAKRNLPVFRLETDYHDNDVEQLRIRLEAFSELLKQDMTSRT